MPRSRPAVALRRGRFGPSDAARIADGAGAGAKNVRVRVNADLQPGAPPRRAPAHQK